MSRRVVPGAAMGMTAGVLGLVLMAGGVGAVEHHRGARDPLDHPIATWSGTGVATTGRFTTPATGWNLTYTFDCNRAPGRYGEFIVLALRTPGEDAMSILRDHPVSRAGTNGSGTAHFRRGGSGVYLQVNSQCSWAMAVTR